MWYFISHFIHKLSGTEYSQQKWNAYFIYFSVVPVFCFGFSISIFVLLTGICEYFIDFWKNLLDYLFWIFSITSLMIRLLPNIIIWWKFHGNFFLSNGQVMIFWTFFVTFLSLWGKWNNYFDLWRTYVCFWMLTHFQELPKTLSIHKFLLISSYQKPKKFQIYKC